MWREFDRDRAFLTFPRLLSIEEANVPLMANIRKLVTQKGINFPSANADIKFIFDEQAFCKGELSEVFDDGMTILLAYQK